jgi:tRNA U34 2-thiouridine synthase MnmA/TrmU
MLMKKIKALVLLSGGLDSMLAAKILMEQGIEVIGASFISCFFGADRAEKAARQLGIKLKKVDFKKEHLKMVKNPPSGYGKFLNPCIDCHALMIKLAGKITEEEGLDFIATGEVLGQRPMSQNKTALRRVEKLAGAEVLRPLSAKLLPEINIERKGLVKRAGLFDISGRSREKQIKLATKYKITEYPSPAGGCLLTDPIFTSRAQEMLQKWPECEPSDMELLKYGRIFWADKNLIITGRSEKENNILEKLAKKGDMLVILEDMMGPLTLVRILELPNSKISKNFLALELKIPKELDSDKLKLEKIKNKEEILRLAGLLTGWYATKARDKVVKLNIKII